MKDQRWMRLYLLRLNLYILHKLQEEIALKYKPWLDNRT